MKIQVTEHKSVGQLSGFKNVVRVFVNNDYHYGYFIEESSLFEMLTEEQKEEYLKGNTAVLDVDITVAQKIIDMGNTPFGKIKLAA